MPKTLASFCRLCLTKTSSKVPVFGGEQENVTNLLALIELSINPETESDAAVCFDCVVTLETFLQFKDQCHVNDEFLKTLPPKDSSESSEAGEEDEDEDVMECDYLEEDDEGGAEICDSEEEQGLVEYVEPPQKKALVISAVKKVPKAKDAAVDPLYIAKPVLKQKAKQESSPQKPRVVSKKPRQKLSKFTNREPTEDELPKLQDSYPDYFHFERGSRTLYYDLVYYGERFNSAIYGTLHTYWKCPYKNTFNCPAVLYVSNDYTEFERRYEHSHGEMKPKGEMEVFTPEQALPTVFRICWKRVQARRARDLEISLWKKESAPKPKAMPTRKKKKTAESKKLKKPLRIIPEFPGPQPTEEELPKLQASYPDCFHFERGHNTLYYDLVYYGERFNSAIFGARHTFWQCAHRRKFKCPARLHVSNDYTEFERRYEHTHGEQKSKGYPELYTPKQALPTLFRIMWHRLKEKRLKKQQTKGLAQEAKNNDELGHGDSYEDYESSQKELELPENGSVDN
uniref:ZAD domain-containing protein n=1 Tax=Culex tarsalis TaxID=7177 RepID=A0A1Q3F0M8_CULTA